MNLPLKQVAAFVFSWIQILSFYLFAVSGHEELRAKHRFRKVTGKEHMHLTQEKFSDLLGPCMCTVLFSVLLPPLFSYCSGHMTEVHDVQSPCLCEQHLVQRVYSNMLMLMEMALSALMKFTKKSLHSGL
jgi:ABC-type Fe3+ transport system permease subunit